MGRYKPGGGSGIRINVYAAGFGSLALALGTVLLLVAFNYTAQHTTDPTLVDQEVSGGYLLIGVGVLAWAVGVIKALIDKYG